ncbi:MAG: hypothetical protein WDZ49_11010 [Litorilinea sp.]
MDSIGMNAPVHNPLLSIPALAAAMRRAHEAARALDHPENAPDFAHMADAARCGPLQAARLVPMYRIAPASPEPAAEAAAAAQMIITLGDRLRRLGDAYGEWSDFDPAAYFDLTIPQTDCLLQLTERVTSVHLAFFTDLLLPSFQNAALYWEIYFLPNYRQMQQALEHVSGEAIPPGSLGTVPTQGESPPSDRDAAAMNTVAIEAAAIEATLPVEVAEMMPGGEAGAAQHFFDEIQPTMIAHWLRALTVARYTRRLLSDDPTFWALNAANDERLRRRWAWRMRPAPGIAAPLLPQLTDIPTLTLAIDFPLPAARQSGRLRRLRRSRAQIRANPGERNRGYNRGNYRGNNRGENSGRSRGSSDYPNLRRDTE